jgi:hypothetical protein
MFNRHFFKTLFIFLLIIATGVAITLAVDYAESRNQGEISVTNS